MPEPGTQGLSPGQGRREREGAATQAEGTDKERGLDVSLMSQLKGIWEGEHALSSLLFCVQIVRTVMQPALTRDKSERE